MNIILIIFLIAVALLLVFEVFSLVRAIIRARNNKNKKNKNVNVIKKGEK